jgi:TonB family protein
MRLKYIYLQITILLLLCYYGVDVQAQTNDCQKPQPLTQIQRDEIIQSVKQIFQGDETANTSALGDLDTAWQGYYLCLKTPRARVGLYPTKSEPVENKNENNRLQDIINSLGLKDEDSASSTTLAQIAFKFSKLEDAHKFAERAIEMDERNFEAHYVLARLKNDLTRVDKAIELNPIFAPAYILKIEILINQVFDAGKPEEQKNKYKTAFDAMETLLSLKNAPDIEFWKEQKDSLSFYLANGDSMSTVVGAASASKENKRLVITSMPRARYSESARRVNSQGTVRLRVTCTHDGQIKNILAVKYVLGLTKHAVEAAKQVKFEPEIKNGVPITVVKNLEYRFNLY